MRITKVYTRTGDKGTTRLADGSEIPKNSLRLESYGTVDELNSCVGICRQFIDELPSQSSTSLDQWLEAIQNDLFNLGGDLATPTEKRWPQMILVGEEEVIALEKLMDICQESFPPLKDFVLPGGTKLNAFLHSARTVCRRAERVVVSLSLQENINPQAVIYLNRLSDLFFVLSRWVQFKANKAEMLWDKTKGIKNLIIE